MARLSVRQLKSIVARDLPGYQLVSRGNSADGVDRRAVAEDVAPEIETARKTSRRRRKNKASAEGATDNPGHGELIEDELVTVERKGASDHFDHASRRKAVVISGEDGRVIGSQG